MSSLREARSRVGSSRALVGWGSLWVLCAAGSAAASETASSALLPERTHVETLENGLQVVVLPVDTPGLVSVQTWMRVGSGEEAVAGLTGFAHFFGT